jgi:uncharacterized membrane protein
MKINNFRTSIAAFVLGSSTFAVGMFSFSAPAQAEFKVCNRSNQTVTLALAYRKEGGWTSHGWYKIDSGLCRTLIADPLEGNVYVYSLNNSLGLRGDSQFCVLNRAFDIVDAKQCGDHGRLEDFQKIETGGNQDYTFSTRGRRH